jgi:hypothetical protein
MPYVSATAIPPEREPRRTDWLWGVLGLLILVTPAVFTTPAAVNSAAWLVGAGRPDTFTSGGVYDTRCGSGCSPVTYGTLASTGQVITWPGHIPDGTAVHFREPVWNVMSPRRPETTGDALVWIALGLFFEAVAVLSLAVFAVHVVRAVRRAGRAAVPISP